MSLCLSIRQSRLNDRIEVQELTTDTVFRLPVNVIYCSVCCGCRDLEGISVRIFDIVLGSDCFLDIVLSDIKSSVLISLLFGIFREFTDNHLTFLVLIDGELGTGEELILVVYLMDIDCACLVAELEFLNADLEISCCRILASDSECFTSVLSCERAVRLYKEVSGRSLYLDDKVSVAEFLAAIVEVEHAVGLVNTLRCFGHDAFLKFTVINELVLVGIDPGFCLLIVLIPNTVVVGVNKYCKLST